MFETLLYLAASIFTVVILVRVTPTGTPVLGMILATIGFVAVLTTARHGPSELVAVFDALARLLGR